MNLLKSFKSFGPALKGMKSAVVSENNFHIHLAGAVAVITLGYYLQVQRNDWLWLTVAIGLVFITEYLNTAIERLTDLVSPQFDERAGKVKDIAAGAVLMAAVIALVIGVLVFFPYVITKFGR